MNDTEKVSTRDKAAFLQSAEVIQNAPNPLEQAHIQLLPETIKASSPEELAAQLTKNIIALGIIKRPDIAAYLQTITNAFGGVEGIPLLQKMAETLSIPLEELKQLKKQCKEGIEEALKEYDRKGEIRSYQEDVKEKIFKPAEASTKMEPLEKTAPTARHE